MIHVVKFCVLSIIIIGLHTSSSHCQLREHGRDVSW